MAVDLEPAQMQNRLLAMKSELSARLKHLERDLAEPLNPDSGERAVEVEDDASLEGQAILVADELASVDRALDRIARGSYGQCVKCGDQISMARLEARPEASLCIRCAEAA